MLDFLKGYSGDIVINDKKINNSDVGNILDNLSGKIKISLIPKNTIIKETTNIPQQYSVYVDSWMLNKSTPDFNFMDIWNKNIPMPMRRMVGQIIKETPRMYYMKLHGELQQEDSCCFCGRPLVNKVAKLIGVGAECCSHLNITVDYFLNNTISETDISNIKNTIRGIQWKGWVPKTALLKIQKIT